MSDKKQSAIDRGHRAKNLLQDPLFAEAKVHIEAELWRKFTEVGPDDAKALAFIKGIQYLHVKYTAFLSRAVQDGKMAELEVERESKLKRVVRKAFG